MQGKYNVGTVTWLKQLITVTYLLVLFLKVFNDSNKLLLTESNLLLIIDQTKQSNRVSFMLLQLRASEALMFSQCPTVTVPASVPLSRGPVTTSALFLSNTKCILLKFREAITAINRGTLYILGEIIPGTREQETTQNANQMSVKTD